MKLTVTPRHPKWIVVSAYVGPKAALKGLTFPTRYTYYKKKIAVAMASLLNSKIEDYRRWPGRHFEFQVVPYERPADAFKEAK